MKILKVNNENEIIKAKVDSQNYKLNITDYSKFGFSEYGDVLTVAETSECLKVSRKTLQKTLDSGKLYYIRIGNMIRIPRYSILVFLGLIEDNLSSNS